MSFCTICLGGLEGKKEEHKCEGLNKTILDKLHKVLFFYFHQISENNVFDLIKFFKKKLEEAKNVQDFNEKEALVCFSELEIEFSGDVAIVLKRLFIKIYKISIPKYVVDLDDNIDKNHFEHILPFAFKFFMDDKILQQGITTDMNFRTLGSIFKQIKLRIIEGFSKNLYIKKEKNLSTIIEMKIDKIQKSTFRLQLFFLYDINYKKGDDKFFIGLDPSTGSFGFDEKKKYEKNIYARFYLIEQKIDNKIGFLDKLNSYLAKQIIQPGLINILNKH